MKISEMSCELLDSMGSDLSVVNAARVSFAKQSEWEYYFACEADKEDNIPSKQLSEKDTKLINYLARHKHWSPFAHCFATFRIKIPMFVAMQLDKHTVGLVTNSVSRRYVDDEPEFWFPKEWRGRPENAKQGSGGLHPIQEPEAHGDVSGWHVSPYTLTDDALLLYNTMIADGYAPEQARMVLPMNTMTERIWSGSLAAFARVCKLRLDAHAQKEIQDFAQMVNDQLEPIFPVSWQAIMENE